MRLTEFLDLEVYYWYVYYMAQQRQGGTRRGRRPCSPGNGRSGARCRWWVEPQGWEVHARVERFTEAALLLLLRDTSTHGYDLADALEELDPDERIDLGNLYRLLRSLEDEGLLSSQWRDDLPGRSKRTYELTEAGRELLDVWAGALTQTNKTIGAFLRRYRKGGQT